MCTKFLGLLALFSYTAHPASLCMPFVCCYSYFNFNAMMPQSYFHPCMQARRHYMLWKISFFLIINWRTKNRKCGNANLLTAMLDYLMVEETLASEILSFDFKTVVRWLDIMNALMTDREQTQSTHKRPNHSQLSSSNAASI